MISIVICSRHTDIPQALKNNIAETTGVEYEIIVIDNSRNEYSIFSAYNEGVRRSKFPYLCFMHEDIVFHATRWGENVLKCFENKRIGLCGVVGGHYAPPYPVPWWQSGLMSGQCLQGYINESGCYATRLDRYPDFLQNKKSIEVVSVDGLWFCIPKSLFDRSIAFDEKKYAGFHCYDIDICFQVRNAGYEVVVIPDILIEHQSMGNIDEKWEKDLIQFYFKWYDKLPVTVGIYLTQEEIDGINQKISEDICAKINRNVSTQKQLQHTLSSKSYRLGKFIFNPFSMLRKVIKK